MRSAKKKGIEKRRMNLYLHEDGRVAKLLREPHGHDWQSVDERVMNSLKGRLDMLPKPDLKDISPEALDRLFEATGWLNLVAADFVYSCLKNDHEAEELISVVEGIGEGARNPLAKRFCRAVANAANNWMDYSEMP